VAADVGADAARLARGDHEVLPVEVRLDAEPLEAEQRGAQVGGAHALDAQLRVGDRRQADERAHLDVVRADRELGAPQRAAALDRERVGPDAADLGAHGDQEPREVLHVRLRGGVAQHRGALRPDGRHEGVLGPGDARLVEEDVVPGEVLRLEVEGRADGDLGAEAAEREEVRVHAAPADDVAARRRQAHPPEAGEHRPGQQDGRADPAAQHRVRIAGPGIARVGDERVLVLPAQLDVLRAEQLEHRLDVADARHVAQRHGAVRQQRGGEDGQGGVLVAGGSDRAVQALASLDHEDGHAPKLRGGAPPSKRIRFPVP